MSKDTDCATSVCPLSQYLSSLRVKKFFLIPNLNVPSWNLSLLLLALSPVHTESKGGNHYPLNITFFFVFWLVMKSHPHPLALLTPHRIIPVLPAFPCMQRCCSSHQPFPEGMGEIGEEKEASRTSINSKLLLKNTTIIPLFVNYWATANRGQVRGPSRGSLRGTYWLQPMSALPLKHRPCCTFIFQSSKCRVHV